MRARGSDSVHARYQKWALKTQAAPAHSVSCVLCDVLAERDDTPARTFISKAELPSEILASGPGIAVIADVAPLGPGHLLLITKRHILAMSHLAPPALAELTSMRALFAGRLQSLYSLPVLAFEHGLCGETPVAGCGIDHAHLHVVPTAVAVDPAFRRDFDVVTLERLASLGEVRQRADEYLLLIPPSGEILAAFPRIPASQYFRKKISQLTVRELWNWNDELLLGQTAQYKQWILELHRLWGAPGAGVAPAAP